MSQVNVINPIYQKISIDLANRISKGEFKIGSKISGRSTLAGQYNVSPETIRRAVTLLEDMKIVEVLKGSGIIVKSKDEAFKYIEKFKRKESMHSLKKNISKTMREKQLLDEQLSNFIDKIMDYSERFYSSNPFAPLEIEIEKDSTIIGKTIADVNFWQNTGATIIGIQRGNSLILSPGPYAVFNEGDIFIIIGEENTYERVKRFINE